MQQQIPTPLARIPDDGTIDAALYGTAHIETVLARETGEKLLRVLSDSVDEDLAKMDVDLASIILEEEPNLVYSDEEIVPGYWPADIEETVRLLRHMIARTLAKDLVAQWMDDADHRGRLVGLGEHSARASATGRSDIDYKAAVAARRPA